MTTTHPFPPGSRLAVYLRDSGGEEQDLSIEQQETALRAWSAQNDLSITQVFRDTRTGTTTAGRAGFESMIRYFFRKKRVPENGILLWRYNRFARDLNDAQYFKAGLRRRGYLIHAINDPVPEGAAGRAVEFLIDWMSDKFSEDLSVEVKRGLRHLLTQYGALPGFPPVGFIREPIDLGRHRNGARHIVHKWVPDPEKWQSCRLAWSMRAAGASYREIHQKTRLLSSINSYTAFYRNKLYLGELHYQDIVIADYCEPLIDRATWDAVQAINQRSARKAAPGRGHPRRVSSSYLLSGLVHCDLCGGLLSGLTIRPSRNNERWAYYRCDGHGAFRCAAPRIPQDALEAAVIDQTIATILDPAVIEAIQREQRALRQEQSGDIAARRDELAARLRAIALRIENITAAIAEAGHSKALLARLSILETEQADLTAQRGELDGWLSSSTTPIDPARIARFSAVLTTLLTTADLPTRRRILHGLIDHITVKRDGRQISGAIYFYEPPAELSFEEFHGPGPPNYVYDILPRGGTRHTHKLPLRAEILRKTKKPR